MKDKIVSLDKIDRILTDSFKQISQAATSVSSPPDQILLTPKDVDLDEKQRNILNHIKNSPGTIKEDVINAFKDRTGYSRKVVFNCIKKLQEYNMITFEVDKQAHHLHFNDHNVINSLIEDIGSFINSYFFLIDNIDASKIDVRGPIEKLKLVNAISMPSRFFITVYADSHTFLRWHLGDIDKQTLFRKFVVMDKEMDRIYYRLLDSLVKNCLIQNGEEISEIFWDRSEILKPDKMAEALKTFEKYGLREYAEVVLDTLWRITRPVIQFIYPYHYFKSPAILDDWRKLLSQNDMIPYKSNIPVRITNT